MIAIRHRVLSAGICIACAACAPREGVRDVGGAREIRVEIPLGFWSKLRAVTTIPKRSPPPMSEVRVLLRVRGSEFAQLSILADGEVFSYPRLAFQSDVAWMPLADLEAIGRAEDFAIQLSGNAAVPLSEDDALRFRRFAAKALAWYDAAAGPAKSGPSPQTSSPPTRREGP